MLKLMEILREQTDEENEYTLDDITECFKKEYGPDVKLNKNSLRDDIEHLIEANLILPLTRKKRECQSSTAINTVYSSFMNCAC